MLSRRTCCALAPLTLLALRTLLALLAGLPLRTLLSRGALQRSCACIATAQNYG